MPAAAIHALSPIRAYLAQRAAYAFFFSLYATYASVRRVVDLGFDPLELVLIGTALEASVFLLEIPTGVVADTQGRRRSVSIGYAIIGVGFALEAISHGFLGVLLAQILWGGGWTFVSGARSAWLADEIGADAAAPVMLRAAVWTRWAALAGLLAAALLAPLGLTWPLAAAAIGFLGIAVALPLFTEEQGFSPRQRGTRSQWRELFEVFRSGVRAARGDRVVTLLLLVGLFAGASSEAFDRLWVLHLMEIVPGGLPALGPVDGVVWFALLQAAALVAGIVSLAVVRPLARHSGEGPVLGVLYALLVVVVGAFALSGGFVWAIAAWIAVQAVRSPMGPLETAWANRRIPSDVRATVLSMLGQADALGQVAGGPGLGLLGRSFGTRAALLASAVLMAPGVALLSRAPKTNREIPAPQPGD